MTDAYFLYHSIGMYPGKAEDMATALTRFAHVWGQPDDPGLGRRIMRALHLRPAPLSRDGRKVQDAPPTS